MMHIVKLMIDIIYIYTYSYDRYEQLFAVSIQDWQ